MIGDSGRDVEAGEAAGCIQSIQVETNKQGALLEVINKIIRMS